jgi:TetR/AcrR family transcriptional repressor of bet genes
MQVKPPRKQPRAARRGQLIEATIEVLAACGYARVTMAQVAKAAGLAHGLVNFHFQSKDLLLTETLTYLWEEYRENWGAALALAGDDPGRQLDALIRADFAPALCTPARRGAWAAFWGEAQCRPLYQEKCAVNDVAYIGHLERICAALLTDATRAPRVARVIRVTIEGVWMDMITQSAPYSREEALATVQAAAAAFFPARFGPDGLLS